MRAPDGSSAVIAIETKRHIDPMLVPVVRDQISRYLKPPQSEGVVLAPYLSPRTRELLTEADLSYADATGNLRLVADRPAIFLATHASNSDPWAKPGDRPLRSLKGPTAGRVVRALVDFRPPYRLEELARRSQISLGSVARVFALLDSEALIQREPRGPVTDVKWVELLRRWTDDHSFGRSNRTQTFLEPRGLPALLDKLTKTSQRYALTGSVAATHWAPVATARFATLYVDDIEEAARDLDLRRAETGANVALAEPFDRVAFERTQESNELVYAAPSQVAADLLTGPGRSPTEGNALLDWMRKNENEWRH